jgi:glucose-6-phosphate-specific signal transduction histidine kinase
MKKTTFRRNPFVGVLYIICTLLFLSAFIIKLMTGSPFAFFSLLLTVLYIINLSWYFGKPFAIIEDDLVTIRLSLAVKKHFSINNLVAIRQLSKNKIEVSFANSSTQVIRLGGMHGNDKQEFYKALTRRSAANAFPYT